MQVLGLLHDQLRVLTAWLQTDEATCRYRGALLQCTYNNIALWRSPEPTGKCRLCASMGRGRRQAQDVFVQPQQQPTLGFGAGVERADVRFQRGCCTPACFTFWVNKVWKSVEGLNAGRWNVAHGGRTEVEMSSRRWMHACKIWELHVKMDSVCLKCEQNQIKINQSSVSELS